MTNDQGYESGVIYRSSILKYYKMIENGDKDLANDYLLAMCETALGMPLTGTNPFVEYMMTELEVLANNNHEKIKKKEEKRRQEKIEKMQLDDIARLIYQDGRNQTETGKILGINQQTISYRLGVIRDEFPELREKYDINLQKLQKIQEVQILYDQDSCDSTKTTKNTETTNFVQIGTNGTNWYNFVQKNEEDLQNYKNYKNYKNNDNYNENVNYNYNENDNVDEVSFSFSDFKKKVYINSYDDDCSATGQEILDDYNLDLNDERAEMANEFPEAYDDLVSLGIIKKEWRF